MFYTVYKTTNATNGKIYIGMHQTENLDDGYIGSGTYLKRALKKYGTQQFTKEILFVFDTFDEMKTKEREIVDEVFVNRDDTYNLNVGGDGGWYRANLVVPVEQRIEISRLGGLANGHRLRNDEGYRKRMAAISRINVQKTHFVGRLYNTFQGKTHTPETIQKMRDAKIGVYDGEKNPCFGHVWVHNPHMCCNRSVKAQEVDALLASGWQRGRVMGPAHSCWVCRIENQSVQKLWVQKKDVPDYVCVGWERGTVPAKLKAPHNPGKPKPRKTSRCRGVITPRVREKHPRTSKLNWGVVTEIRARYATGEYTYRSLGDLYQMSHTTMRSIVTLKMWVPEN